MDTSSSTLKEIFLAKELVLDQNGELVETTRPVGQNDIAMVAWLCLLRTPEYPDGREMATEDRLQTPFFFSFVLL